MLTRKKQQPSTTPILVTTKTPTYKAKEVSRKHLFSDDLFLQEKMIILRKELDNRVWIHSETRTWHDKNIQFNDDIDVTNKYKLMKER